MERIEVFEDADELARAAADHIGAWLRADDHRTLGLAGGSTPRLTYEHLRSQDVPWDRSHLWLTDERHVPPDHPDSNTGMARNALLNHVDAHFHPVAFDPDPAVAAARYQQDLDRMWGGAAGHGLMLLGIGDDGHTASLFPATSALDEPEPAFVANWVPQMESWRMTATLPLLASADRLIFLVAGTAKAGVVAQILGDCSDHPAGRVSRAAPDSWWMLDRAAAAELR